MNDVADSSSLNKPIKINFNICMHIFLLLFFMIFLGLGPAQPIWLGLTQPARPIWAGLDPASPARSLAQASDWAVLPAGVRELLTHACYRNMQLKCREGKRNLPVAALEDEDDN
jgi:hypothetical protein